MSVHLGWWARRRARKTATKMLAKAIAEKVNRGTYDHKRDYPGIIVEVANELALAFNISVEEAGDICLKAAFDI